MIFKEYDQSLAVIYLAKIWQSIWVYTHFMPISVFKVQIFAAEIGMSILNTGITIEMQVSLFKYRYLL